MATDSKSIQNQKVFVRLEDVLYLQSEIHRLQDTSNDAVREANKRFARGLIRAVTILQLPLRGKLNYLL